MYEQFRSLNFSQERKQVSDNYFTKMKCTQKSCQRSKGILSSELCNVCNEVVVETTAKNNQKSPQLKKIDLNIKELLNIHE